jgi:hypothetical protein
MAVLSMSKQEFSRLEVLLRIQSGRLRVEDACALIGLRRRQVFRLLRGLRQDGATSLLSKRRGKPGNHRLPPEVRTLALDRARAVCRLRANVCGGEAGGAARVFGLARDLARLDDRGWALGRSAALSGLAASAATTA